MSGTIKSSVSGVSELSKKILEELESYISFALVATKENGSTPALSEHDDMSNSVTSALDEWKELIISDEASLQQIQANFLEVDQADVMQILGVGA